MSAITDLRLLVLHPKYKLSYFQLKKWPQAWVDTAREVLHEHWSTNYKPSGSDEPATQSSTSSVRCELYFIYQTTKQSSLVYGRKSLRSSWQLWCWCQLRRTGRISQHTDDCDEEPRSSRVVVRYRHIKSTSSHGYWFFIYPWYATNYNILLKIANGLQLPLVM